MDYGVGKLFTTNGKDVWRKISYCEHPTETYVNIETGQEAGAVVGTSTSGQFIMLVPEKEIEGQSYEIMG